MKPTIYFILAAITLSLGCSGNRANSNGNRQANSANQTASTPAPTPTPTPANDEADVKKLVNQFAEALSKNDADALENIYSDGYVLVTGTGDVTTKADRLAAIRKGDVKFAQVSFEEVSVRAYGNTAIVLAKALGSTTTNGKTQNSEERVTLFANKENDTWRLVSAQITPITSAATTTGPATGSGSNSNLNSNSMRAPTPDPKARNSNGVRF